MSTVNVPTGMWMLKSETYRVSDRLSTAKNVSGDFYDSGSRKQCIQKEIRSVKSVKIAEQNQGANISSPNGPLTSDKLSSSFEIQNSNYSRREAQITSDIPRKTKIVCTIGPFTSSREMIWKLAGTGMNVALLNMSHGDHASHQKTIDLVKEYNAQFEDKVIAITLVTNGPEVRSGDVPQPILLKEGQEFNFAIKRGVSTANTVSVNYDNFVNDVEIGDIVLVDVKDIS